MYCPLKIGGTINGHTKTSLAIFLFAAAILASAIGIIYLPIALGLLVVLFRILALEGLYESIEWPVIVLLGSIIPLGLAWKIRGKLLF
jgi:di/tricarboxylate transporter